MEYVEQRLLGAKLAASGGDKWEKTLATIRSSTSCYEDIMKTAAREGGVDALVPQLLQGPPEWAAQALRYIPDLGRHREALVKKAAEDPDSAVLALHHAPGPESHNTILRNGAAQLANSLGQISGMSLKDNGGYDCKFTLKWVNNGQLEPQTSYPNWNDWKWSALLLLGQDSGRIPLSFFALPNAPLQDGTDVESPLRFTANSHTLATATFSCDGTTTSPELGFTGFNPPQ